MAFNLDLWENLVHVVFGNAYLFGGIMMLLFAWYTVIYDISWWAFSMFAVLFFTWMAYTLIGEWIFIVIAIGVSFFVAVQIFRKLRT